MNVNLSYASTIDIGNAAELQTRGALQVESRSDTLPRDALQRPPTSLWRDALERLLKNRLAIVGGIIVIGLVLLAIFGPYLTPYSYRQQDTALIQELRGPANPGEGGHVLGTDILGRDLLSRLMDGARISMTVALVVQIVVSIVVTGIPLTSTGGEKETRPEPIVKSYRRPESRYAGTTPS